MSSSSSVEEEEGRPTELNTINHTRFLEVAKDKLTVKYVGKGNHAHDVGAIQANRACPTQCMVYYYEVTILDSGSRGCIAVGLADKQFLLNRQPGWEPNSYAFHGDDGRKYHDSERGEAYGPTFSMGDVVGCGLHFHQREVFFTKNGKHLGIAYRNASCDLYPTLGLHSPNETVSINFGAKPFKFDIDSLIAEEREKKAKEVAKFPIQVGDLTRLMRTYFMHYGYEDTLNCFDKMEGPADDTLVESLRQRKQLRKAVLEGSVDKTFRLVEELFPSILDKNTHVKFLLKCQQFIELVRQQQVMVAVAFAQEELAVYRDTMEELYPNMLNDVVALLAYTDPSDPKVPVHHYMGMKHREFTADALNAAVLAEYNAAESSALEVLMRQLVAAHWAIREENGGRGEVFRLQL